VSPGDLVSVTPVLYEKRRIQRFYGYKLEAFDAEKLSELIGNAIQVEYMPKIWEDSVMIFYEYPEKPLIIIYSGQFFTTKDIWNGREYPHKQIRHQASLVLRLLYRLKLATYHRKAIPRKRFTPRQWRKENRSY
jgi:hypothetical protein